MVQEAKEQVCEMQVRFISSVHYDVVFAPPWADFVDLMSSIGLVVLWVLRSELNAAHVFGIWGAVQRNSQS